MAKVYALIDCGWDDFVGDSYSETENCLGIFTSQELVVKAANDFLTNCLNAVKDYDEKEDYIFSETPITFEQLYGDNDYEYYNHTDHYGARLYVYEYELDKCEF